MELKYQVVLSGLSSERDLWVSTTAPVIAQQLRGQGRLSSNSYRYRVTIEIIEGRTRPAMDVDNYAKKAIDGITRTGLLWHDDEQIDFLAVRRRRNRSRRESQIVVRIRRTEGQHSSVPSFFRACCHEASLGAQYTYAHPGYHMALNLHSQQPYDLSEDEWASEIKDLCDFLDAGDTEGVWNWFCEHFPKCMKLVPRRRFEQFVSGVGRAYDDGRITE